MLKENRLIHYRVQNFQAQLKKPATVARPTTSASRPVTTRYEPQDRGLGNYSTTQYGQYALNQPADYYRNQPAKGATNYIQSPEQFYGGLPDQATTLSEEFKNYANNLSNEQIGEMWLTDPDLARQVTDYRAGIYGKYEQVGQQNYGYAANQKGVTANTLATRQTAGVDKDAISSKNLQGKLDAIDKWYQDEVNKRGSDDPNAAWLYQNYQNKKQAAYSEEAARQQQMSSEGAERRFRWGSGQTGRNEQIQDFTPEFNEVNAMVRDSALESALTSIPDMPESQGLKDALRQQNATESHIQSMLAGMTEGRISDAKQLFRDIGGVLASQEARANQTFNQAMARYEKSASDQQKFLSLQQSNQIAQLNYMQERQTREARQNLRKQLDGMTITMALMGRAGSTKANYELEQAEYDGEQAILDFQREIGFKRQDVLTEYTGKYIEIQDNLNNAWHQAKDKLDSKLSQLSTQGITNLQMRQSSIEAAVKDMANNWTQSKRNAANQVVKLNEWIYGQVAEERKNKIERQNDLWNRLFKQRALEGNLNPGATMRILSDMKDAGIDVSGIDPNAMTESQVNELHRNSLTLQKMNRDMAGKQLTPTLVRTVSQFDSSLSNLDDLGRAIEQYEGVGGPVAGKIYKYGGTQILEGFSDTIARQSEFTAVSKRVKQLVGKAMEDGVLRKEDEEKYEQMIPSLTDSDRLRRFKIKELRSAITAQKNAFLNSLSVSGYDVSGHDMGDPIYQLEEKKVTNDQADEILKQLETGQLEATTPTGFLNTLAKAHQAHEGYGTKAAKSITANNNPGALRWHSSHSKLGGIKPGDKKPDGTINNTGFTWFPDYASGHKALIGDLRAKITGKSAHIDYSKNPTILDYIAVYAPAGDGNNPSAYAQDIVKRLRKAGYDVNYDTRLSELSNLIA